jgi:hypothetical protein
MYFDREILNFPSCFQICSVLETLGIFSVMKIKFLPNTKIYVTFKLLYYRRLLMTQPFPLH